LLESLLAAEPWIIEAFRVDRTGRADRNGESARVEMRGWALPDPELGAASPGRFLINGQPFPEIEYPIEREDIRQKIWMREHSLYSGFRCVAEGAYEEIYRDGVTELAYLNPGPRRRIPAQQSYFFLDPEREGAAPEQARRFRVVGNNNLDEFLLSGFTDVTRFDAAAQALGGKGLAGYRRILDWGCGCGRLARYVAQLPGVELSGCDIDADNLGWCAAHLQGSFMLTRMHPPLPFAAGSFDLVYGLSVFTHLREALQDQWLAELQRVSAPGALLLMTIHGQTALDYCGAPPALHAELARLTRTQGIYESGVNDQLDGFADHAGEYVNVFHDRDYVLARWGASFEILDILPGYIFTHDLVVMRRR
jgi:SAM-dependent methyltransferase